MDINLNVVLFYLLILSCIQFRYGVSNFHKETHKMSKRQIDLLPGGSESHLRTRQLKEEIHCLPNEYGHNCTYCIAKDTCEEGHYKCDTDTGSKVCLPGYQGKNCRISTQLANSYYDVTCPENTCRNGGSCASGYCCCRDGFMGILCEIEIIECKSNSCLNGGICKDLIGKYECLCKPSYEGTNCEIRVAHVQTTPSRDSGCQSKSCLNNGTCLEDTYFTYCLCSTYFTGDHCETYIGSVQQNACPENYYGTGCQTFCSPENNCFGHYVCNKADGKKICTSGWDGPNCDARGLPQRIDPECPLHGCKNDGQCSNGRCCCKYNYTGENCQIESIGCLSSPCQNNATCTSAGNGFLCHCRSNFTGKMCENIIRSPTTTMPTSNALIYNVTMLPSTSYSFQYSTDKSTSNVINSKTTMSTSYIKNHSTTRSINNSIKPTAIMSTSSHSIFKYVSTHMYAEMLTALSVSPSVSQTSVTQSYAHSVTVSTPFQTSLSISDTYSKTIPAHVTKVPVTSLLSHNIQSENIDLISSTSKENIKATTSTPVSKSFISSLGTLTSKTEQSASLVSSSHSANPAVSAGNHHIANHLFSTSLLLTKKETIRSSRLPQFHTSSIYIPQVLPSSVFDSFSTSLKHSISTTPPIKPSTSIVTTDVPSNIISHSSVIPSSFITKSKTYLVQNASHAISSPESTIKPLSSYLTSQKTIHLPRMSSLSKYSHKDYTS
ncbi:protein crumbs homolog 1-like [Ruditapes philippinarum]|uniref:protein crumbs homolog 1-like n=1 Tax=Ruditapes philippinarum TaxID=129788 RepID=UPI00295C2925|nr:protein crumbs homolog 1-like [Ruditapes philippinarum]